jgi:hypothetical protein
LISTVGAALPRAGSIRSVFPVSRDSSAMYVRFHALATRK